MQEAVVPPGTPHRWWNSEDEAARILVELRPALNTEIFFETLYRLARDGKTDDNGVPNLLQQAVTLNGINKGEIYLARPPMPIQKASLAVLAPVGGCSGTKTTTRNTVERKHRVAREPGRRPRGV